MKILVSRTDRAGDLILTLPIFRELKKAFADAEIIAHVKRYTAPILALCPEVSKIIIDDDYKPGLYSHELAKAFKAEKPDRAIIVHPSARAILAAYRAGIKIRTGRASNIWQFFLNDKRVQKRSRNVKHEFKYNLDLLEGLVNNISYKPYKLAIQPNLLKKAQEHINKINMNGAVIIHPGHGGSAKNLPLIRYAEIAKSLLEQNVKVLISLGPNEEALKGYFSGEQVGKLAYLCGVPNMAELAALFSTASCFIGGSTGPLHLAAGLNLPCAAFFPPVKAMTPKRWGPAGVEGMILKPSKPAFCMGKCKGCDYNPCMQSISIAPVISFAKHYFG